MKYKINEEKLQEVLELYGLKKELDKILGKVCDAPFNSVMAYLDYELIECIKNNDLTKDYSSSVKMLITILNPHFNEIFTYQYDEDEVVDTLVCKYDMHIENGIIVIDDNAITKLSTLIDYLNGDYRIDDVELVMLKHLLKEH